MALSKAAHRFFVASLIAFNPAADIFRFFGFAGWAGAAALACMACCFLYTAGEVGGPALLSLRRLAGVARRRPSKGHSSHSSGGDKLLPDNGDLRIDLVDLALIADDGHLKHGVVFWLCLSCHISSPLRTVNCDYVKQAAWLHLLILALAIRRPIGNAINAAMF